mmetsp:Transcript_12319/g.39012  ORF Transcript_12319/g.39012 Transcript_12319/m.39012 type:complete len:182 (-) Transcript_12319:356-901(-)
MSSHLCSFPVIGSYCIDEHVDFNAPSLFTAAQFLIGVPLAWNIVARIQYKTNFLVRAFNGDRVLATYFLAVCIFTASTTRDVFVQRAIDDQATIDPGMLGRSIAVGLGALGTLFVLSSYAALGLTGTYLGDYCGILMDEPVTGFPFSVLEHPMCTYPHAVAGAPTTATLTLTRTLSLSASL